MGNADASRLAILSSAERLLKRRGVASTTIEAVARETRCAKGLVHYHFKTKPTLLSAVAQQLGTTRQTAWSAAFRAPSPNAAIQQTWELLSQEVRDGTFRAWTALMGERDSVTGQSVRKVVNGFATALSEAASDLLLNLELKPTIPAREVGWLLAAVVQGTGMQLEAGGNPTELQGAYSAAWLGVLSLTR